MIGVGWVRFALGKEAMSGRLGNLLTRASHLSRRVGELILGPKQSTALAVRPKGKWGEFIRAKNRALANKWVRYFLYFLSLPGSLPATGIFLNWLWELVASQADAAAEAIIKEAERQDSDRIRKTVEENKKKLLRKLRKFPKQIGHPFVRDLARLTPHRGKGFVQRRDGSYWYSGRAAANWVVRQTLGTLKWLIPPSPDRDEMVYMVSERAKKVLYSIGQQADFSGRSIRFYISNPVHYLSYLNAGTSPQARFKYIDYIVAAHQRRFKRLYDKHFSYYDPEDVPPDKYLEALRAIRSFEGLAEYIESYEERAEKIKSLEGSPSEKLE